MSHGYDFDIPLLHMVLFLLLACIALYESRGFCSANIRCISPRSAFKAVCFLHDFSEPIAIRCLITAFGCFGKHFAEFSV